MPSRKKTQAEKRAALVVAATDVFAERGFAAATMGEIAHRAVVAKGTPYLYFKDKPELFYAVFESFSADMLESTSAALETAETAPARLRAVALGAADYMDFRREWFPLSLEVWSASNTPALRERFAVALQALYARYREQTAAIIRHGQEAGEVRPEVDAGAVAVMLVGAMDGLFLQCWFDPALDARHVIEQFFDTLFDHGLVLSRNAH